MGVHSDTEAGNSAISAVSFAFKGKWGKKLLVSDPTEYYLYNNIKFTVVFFITARTGRFPRNAPLRVYSDFYGTGV